MPSYWIRSVRHTHTTNQSRCVDGEKNRRDKERRNWWVQRKHVDVKNTHIYACLWTILMAYNPPGYKKLEQPTKYAALCARPWNCSLNRSLSTRWHPAHQVSLLVLHPREIQALSQLMHDKETGGFCDHRACISPGGRILTLGVCSFHSSSTSTPSVRAVFHPWEIQALWSQNYGTGNYVVARMRISR